MQKFENSHIEQSRGGGWHFFNGCSFFLRISILHLEFLVFMMMMLLLMLCRLIPCPKSRSTMQSSTTYSRLSIIWTFDNPNLSINRTNRCKAMLLISTHLQFDNPNCSIIRTQVWQCKCLDYRVSTVYSLCAWENAKKSTFEPGQRNEQMWKLTSKNLFFYVQWHHQRNLASLPKIWHCWRLTVVFIWILLLLDSPRSYVRVWIRSRKKVIDFCAVKRRRMDEKNPGTTKERRLEKKGGEEKKRSSAQFVRFLKKKVSQASFCLRRTKLRRRTMNGQNWEEGWSDKALKVIDKWILGHFDINKKLFRSEHLSLILRSKVN